MKKLFLDDFRDVRDCTSYMIPGNIYWKVEDWVIVRSYDEFVEYITKNGLPSLISFDHDLADEHYNNDAMYESEKAYNELYSTFREKTGYECAKWLIDYCLDNKKNLPDFLVHSMNPVGKKNIEDLLNNYRKHESELLK